jgi:peroxiredoxin (alkyl hydroperoxide reductase subunit C)
MRNTARITLLITVIALVAPALALGQVLGACGTQSEDTPAPAREAGAIINSPVPLPGQYAINFELPAVVGDDIKPIKLSDYNGKWRVVCFYPADFTFV